MKKRFLIIFLLGNLLLVNGQGFSTGHYEALFSPDLAPVYSPQGEDYAISRFALSVNPLGFLEFGPMVNAEFGLTKSLVLNAHLRFAPYGVLSYVVTDWPEKFTGFAYGGGLIYFLGQGRNKPYVGVLSEYMKNENAWDVGETYEERETDKVLVFLINGGYRFRFESGFFINTGAFLGAGHSRWVSTIRSETDNGTRIVPVGLIEVTLGFEF